MVKQAPPTTTHTVIVEAPAPDYLIATIVDLIICCLFGGLIGLVTLIPALICAITVSLNRPHMYNITIIVQNDGWYRLIDNLYKIDRANYTDKHAFQLVIMWEEVPVLIALISSKLVENWFQNTSRFPCQPYSYVYR